MIDMESAPKQDREETKSARVERAQKAVERVLVLVATAQDALIEAHLTVVKFEEEEYGHLPGSPDDPRETDAVGSAMKEAEAVSYALLRVAKYVVDQAYDGILHNSGRMQYCLEQEMHGKQQLT
jgi:hypothetical protein